MTTPSQVPRRVILAQAGDRDQSGPDVPRLLPQRPAVTLQEASEASAAGRATMDQLERRQFIQGAAIGALVFTVGGAEVLLTPRAARTQGVPLRTVRPQEAETLEAVGETLVPGARQAGLVHFIDQQLSVSPDEALLEARILNVRPPYVNFYRAAIAAIERASQARNGGKRFVELDAADQHDFIDRMRQNTLDGWQGPVQAFVYLVMRSDAVDVVYGTMDGYARLDIPYMAHIAPTTRW